MTNLQSFAEQFVSSTRRYLFIQPEDGVLILRPNKVHHLDWQAADKNRIIGWTDCIRLSDSIRCSQHPLLENLSRRTGS